VERWYESVFGASEEEEEDEARAATEGRRRRLGGAAALEGVGRAARRVAAAGSVEVCRRDMV
jgi:hypothetical protein